MKLSESGVRNPVTTAMVFLAVLLLGIVSYTMLSVDMMPEIETPEISVVTTWDGASTEDIETKITQPLEAALGSVTDLDEISSNSREGRSFIRCKFKWGTELGEASNDMRDLVDRVKRNLPDEADPPVLFKFNTSNMPILFCGILARENREGMQRIVDDELVDAIKRIPGVGSCQAFGGLERQINVFVDTDRLSAYGLSLSEVSAAIARDNQTLPAGTLKIGPTSYTMRVPAEYKTAEETAQVVVKRNGNAVVRLGDVARVEDGFKERENVTETNGKWSRVMIVQKRSGENTVDVCRRVIERIHEIEPTLPADYEVRIIGDSSDVIQRSIRSVSKTVLYGGIFVVLTTLVFLRSLRTSLIIVLTIPFSLIIAFIFMFLMGWTINIMSMSALSIAIGMVVDNAVVVLENIVTHMARGVRKREAAMFGADEVGLAIVASTLTTVVVFVPLVFVKGVAGIMMKQLGGLVVATLAASLFCSLYLTPMLASRLLKPESEYAPDGLHARFMRWSERPFVALERAYGRLLGGALRARWLVVALAAAIIGGTIWLFTQLGSELMPSEDTAELRISFELPLGTRHERTAEVGRRIVHHILQTIPENEILEYSFQAGAGGSFGGGSASHSGSVRLKLVKETERTVSTDEYGARITDAVREWPEIARVFSSSDTFMNRRLRGGGANLLVQVFGYDLRRSADFAERVAERIKSVDGIRDIRVSQDNDQPQIQIRVDRLRATALGLSMNDVAQSMYTLFQGNEASQFRDQEDLYTILVRLDEPGRRSIEDVRRAELVAPGGRRVRLDSIAEVAEITGPVEIRRKNQQRVVNVEFDALGRSQGEVMDDVRKVVGEMLLPEGISVEYGGIVEEQAKSEHDLQLMILLGVMLVYMVMAGQFESLLHPFLILFSMPFAGSGVAIALWLTDTPLCMTAYIGIILLVGVVVNNAIVLIDYIGLLRARGLAVREAIVDTGRQRLRPVLITTLTTLLGMMPMAFSHSEGASIWRPLGLTVIGGLSVSTLVTLLIVPVLYYIVEGAKGGAAGRAPRRQGG